MTMRKMVMLAAVLLLAANFAVFAAGQPEVKEDVTIQIAFPVAVDAPIVDMFNGYADEFMAEHPNVTIEPVYAGGYTDVKTMIQTTIDGGGKAPALAVMLATDLFDLANAQYVVPMTDFVKKMKGSDKYLNDFLPAFMANSYYMDELYSLPFQRSAVVLYYNADMISEAGLPVPSDWASLAKTASALTTADRWGIEWPSGWPYWLFQPLALGAGQNIVGESDTQVFFDSPEVIEAIEFYIALSEKYKAMPAGVQGSWGNVVPNFVSGNTAMIVHSSGSLSKILSQADFNVGVMGVPGKTSGSYSVPGGGNIYMTPGLSDAEALAAFQFAVFMTDPARAAEFSVATGYIAPRKSAFDDTALKTYAAENPQVMMVKDVLADAGKEFSLQNLGQIRNIFHSYLQKAYNKELSPAAAMKAAQKEADEALADFR